MNLLDEALLEDSPEILAAAQEATSNLLCTYEAERKVYQMLRDVFQLESSKKFENCE
jgi:hypothetical protein